LWLGSFGLVLIFNSSYSGYGLSGYNNWFSWKRMMMVECQFDEGDGGCSGFIGVRLYGLGDCNGEFSLKRVMEEDRFSRKDDNMWWFYGWCTMI